MEPEIGEAEPYVEVAAAVRAGDAAVGAESAARALLERGAQGVLAALERVVATQEESR